MNEWEAKYKAVLEGIKDKDVVDNAEALVTKAVQLSMGSHLSFLEAFEAMLQAAHLMKSKPQISRAPSGVDILNVWP